MKTAAIVLAAGSGRRMGSDTPKQFLPLCGKPMICYSLEAFENSSIDSIILVTSPDSIEFCQKEIVEAHHYKKVSAVIAGGAERYDSVYEGIKKVPGTDYIFIHDGARPMVTTVLIESLLETVQREKACVAAVPVKDTIKVSDTLGYALETPDRKTLWTIQTPQVFSYELVKQAYEAMYRPDVDRSGVTDDAMVVESFTDAKVKLAMGDYKNIKVTTPEDLIIAECFLKNSENR